MAGPCRPGRHGPDPGGCGVSAETFGKCLTQLPKTFPRKRAVRGDLAFKGTA